MTFYFSKSFCFIRLFKIIIILMKKYKDIAYQPISEVVIAIMIFIKNNTMYTTKVNSFGSIPILSSIAFLYNVTTDHLICYNINEDNSVSGNTEDITKCLDRWWNDKVRKELRVALI